MEAATLILWELRHSSKFSYAELMLELGFDTLSKQSLASYGSARFDYF
ncbi:hypothetical protein LEP1GSC179_3998 [Leptospira santarosai str. MOR084]|uniref:Uncharacterized protein n=1 Tax=Leptospira santarosai str. MOR084 TaxID=1049984 RepID=A0A0E2BAK1_9LEPT|nr:hypothetical protein LEP1GSC179_3998 [Leptospira santarosai str. MOR084]